MMTTEAHSPNSGKIKFQICRKTLVHNVEIVSTVLITTYKGLNVYPELEDGVCCFIRLRHTSKCEFTALSNTGSPQTGQSTAIGGRGRKGGEMKREEEKREGEREGAKEEERKREGRRKEGKKEGRRERRKEEEKGVGRERRKRERRRREGRKRKKEERKGGRNTPNVTFSSSRRG